MGPPIAAFGTLRPRSAPLLPGAPSASVGHAWFEQATPFLMGKLSAEIVAHLITLSNRFLLMLTIRAAGAPFRYLRTRVAIAHSGNTPTTRPGLCYMGITGHCSKVNTLFNSFYWSKIGRRLVPHTRHTIELGNHKPLFCHTTASRIRHCYFTWAFWTIVQFATLIDS
jgi:hypothetical protein